MHREQPHKQVRRDIMNFGSCFKETEGNSNVEEKEFYHSRNKNNRPENDKKQERRLL